MTKCGEHQCMDDALDCRRDVYVTCTLPKGHDGDHRAVCEDEWKRIVVTFQVKDQDDD